MERLSLRATAGLAAAAAGLALGRTTTFEHRVLTHRSLAVNNPKLEGALQVSGAHLTDSRRWATVHRLHHSLTDANAEGFIRVADYLGWHESQTSRRGGQLDIPDTVHGLDPVLTELGVDETREIGEVARELVGGKYQPPLDYSAEEANLILNGREPRYFYEGTKDIKNGTKRPLKFDPNNLPSLHDIRFMLRDPHAPALHRQGIPGVLLHNATLYSYAEQNFGDAQLRPDDLQPGKLDNWLREHRRNIRWGYVAGMAAAHLALTRPKSAEQAAISAASGAAASGLAVVGLLFGGNVTNGLGHAGDVNKLSWGEFWAGKVYPKEDGTYTTNNKLLGPPTLDEVGGQEVHHAYPDRIAYTDEASLLGQLEQAPFGKLLEFMANRDILFRIGDNFNGAPRPDMLNPAVLRIQELRRKRLAEAA